MSVARLNVERVSVVKLNGECLAMSSVLSDRNRDAGTQAHPEQPQAAVAELLDMAVEAAGAVVEALER